MTEKLTKRLIDAMTYEDGNPKDIRWDSEITGFGIRLYPSGKKSFVLFYRIEGKQVLYTIGQYGKITLDRARELAAIRFGEVANNKDPLKARKAAKKKNEWTIQRAAADFIEKYAKEHTKNWKEAERIFNYDLIPALGKKAIDDVNQEDINKLLDKIIERGSKTMANRTLAHVRKLFNWCVSRGLIPYSPAYKILAPAKNITRDRVLNNKELRELWLISDEMVFPFGNVFKFLILTGQRRTEVATMRWEDINKDKASWTIPREMNKSDREHTIPLPPLAMQLLEEIPLMGPYVFTVTGKRPFENFGRAKPDMDRLVEQKRKQKKAPKIRPWRLHDLRRSFASGMASLKVAPHVVEKMLNHSSGTISGVAAIYNRHEYFDEMKEAMGLWSDHIQEILDNEELEKSVVGRV